MTRSIARLPALFCCVLLPFTACDDGEDDSTTVQPRTAKGECVSLAGTGGTGSSFTWKGYFPDDLGDPYWSEREWQRLVHRDVAEQSTAMLVGSIEMTGELDGACESICKNAGFGWGGGGCVNDVEISLGRAVTIGRTLTARQYAVEVDIEGVAGCSCSAE